MIKYIEIPKNCPYCNAQLIIKKENNSEVLFCPNEQCESRLVNRLDHFCGKRGLDIKGLSKATLTKFIDWGWVDKIEDLYHIFEAHGLDFILKPGFGDKSVTKILNAIENSKHTTLDAYISAFGIPLIGKTAAKELTQHFETYKDFRAAVDDKKYSFATLPHFGPEMNFALKSFDYTEADCIAPLFFIESTKNTNEEKIINDKLKDKIIVITGKLTTFKNRNELKDLIIKNGGKVSDSITSKTSLLINNDINSNSSKNKAAKSKGIPIISEADFIQSYIEK